MDVVVLSPWQAGVRRPGLQADYPALSWALLEDKDAGRFALTVFDAPPALLADYRYPQVPAFPYTLEDYRAAVLASLSLWRDSWTVQAGGLTLAAGLRDQALFTSLVTLHQLAVSQGAETSATTTWLVDAAGTQHAMTVGTLLGTLLAYGSAVQANQSTFYARQAAARAAQSAADLDAVALE